MKKFLFLFLSLAVLSACSNDDDNEVPQEEDPIVGTWVLIDASEPIDAQICFDEESTITFNPNNSGQATFYLTAQCVETSSPGNWSKTNSTTYTMSIPVIGELTGTVNFTSDDSFTFTTNLGVLTFTRQ